MLWISYSGRIASPGGVESSFNYSRTGETFDADTQLDVTMPASPITVTFVDEHGEPSEASYVDLNCVDYQDNRGYYQMASSAQDTSSVVLWGTQVDNPNRQQLEGCTVSATRWFDRREFPVDRARPDRTRSRSHCRTSST